ncbi:Mor transcription activator family protein [Anaeromassilibacillus senegalensis]|uniref:Mor transcription activator family protein n=1 Tax=Anaeromassilibacillus senegalensis TaxID=1673717 RepID=UPI0006806564|nr:Mor transcription activator family protein [Anaeromassilibacillus senegalensis]
MDDFLEHLSLENLKGEQLEIAETIGIEPYRELVRRFSGSQIRIWTVDRLTKKIRDDQIRKEYNGHNVKQLARKYHLSDQTIWEITSNARKIGEQESLF